MKKKTYAYIGAPVVLLLIFVFGFYLSGHKDYESRENAKIKAEQDARQARLAKEAKDREIAVKVALEMQEKRRRDKKEKEEIEVRDREAREKARTARDAVGREADKLEQQARRLQKEIETERKQLAEIQAEGRRIGTELDLVQGSVQKAQLNAKGMTGLIEHIDLADKAAAEAARLIAEAAAKAVKK
jgi:hypothetical protein